jgi:hypothetical protein
MDESRRFLYCLPPLLRAPTPPSSALSAMAAASPHPRLASPPADGRWPPSPRAAGGRGPAAPRARRIAGEHLHPAGSRSPRAGQHLHRAGEGDRGGWRGRRESAGSGGGGPCSAELRPPGVGEEARNVEFNKVLEICFSGAGNSRSSGIRDLRSFRFANMRISGILNR